jgi:hypothetical protein
MTAGRLAWSVKKLGSSAQRSKRHPSWDRTRTLLIQSRDLEGTGFGQLGRRRPLVEHGCPLQLLQFARFCPEKR